MANFENLKFSQVQETDMDKAIKSKSENGLVKTRLPYTKIRKSFMCTPVLATQVEVDELTTLFNTVRSVLSFLWTHPYEEASPGVPKTYTVRFKENIKITKDGKMNGFYKIEPFTLEEV